VVGSKEVAPDEATTIPAAIPFTFPRFVLKNRGVCGVGGGTLVGKPVGGWGSSLTDPLEAPGDLDPVSILRS